MSTACAHDHSHAGRTEKGVAAALARAAHLCEEAGERWTEPRRNVFEQLLKASAPMKAYDLLPALGEGGAPAKPPTAYRALEFLEKQGLVHRIESINAYVACDDRPGAHVAAFLLCDCCGQAKEFNAGGDRLSDAIGRKTKGFKVREMVLEVRGLCAQCG